MTKAAILRYIEEMERKLAELRGMVEKLPEATERMLPDVLADLGQEESEGEADDLRTVFGLLREMWNIPPDVKPTMPLEQVQRAMAESLPENWASRELMRMREE